MVFKDALTEGLMESLWKGYSRHDFILDGRPGIVIHPRESMDGNPWVWRTEFFDIFAQADMAMIEKGWHLAYYKVSDMYGSPEAVRAMRQFQTAVEQEFNLHPKATLFGFSRGGLYAFNYAAAYPQKVAALYLDAPVLDIRSWPGGKGKGDGAPAEWQECLECYGLTEEEAEKFEENPLDKIDIVLGGGIPVMVVAGDADTVVPYEENAAILVRKYADAGGPIQWILKPGVGHHPHSLENPEPITDFLCSVY